jgi:hypothetical protein
MSDWTVCRDIAVYSPHRAMAMHGPEAVELSVECGHAPCTQARILERTHPSVLAGQPTGMVFAGVAGRESTTTHG